MIRGLVVRPAEPEDFAAIAALVEAAFGQPDEARLVERLREDEDAVLELVAVSEGLLVGHVLFCRLTLEAEGGTWRAIALAPIAVLPGRQGTGIGSALIENAHRMLREAGERLCVVLGEPAYYGRFGYRHGRASRYECEWQCEALQALSWGEVPETGRLVYPRAFSGL